MDEVSAEAKLASEGVAQPLVVAVPRLEVQRAIDEEQEADLMLDVVRTNGQREERRVFVALDGETLRRLIADQEGDQILVAVDPESLATSFDDVDAHGLREIGATLAIAVAAVGAGAGTAGAEGLQPALSTDHAVQATVQEAGMPRAMPSDYAQARAGEEQMPRAMPSDYAAADDSSATLRRDPGAMPDWLGAYHRPSRAGSRTSVRLSLRRRRHLTRRPGSRLFASVARRFPIPQPGSRTSARNVDRQKSETVAQPSLPPARVQRWRSREEHCSRSQRPPLRFGAGESPDSPRHTRRWAGATAHLLVSLPLC